MNSEQIYIKKSEPIISPLVIHWFKRGWEVYTKNWKILILGSLIYWGVFIIEISITSLRQIPFLIWFIPHPTIFLSVGYYFISLLCVRNENLKLIQILYPFKRFFTIWFAQIIYFFIIFGGVLLLIIPAIIWFIKYMLYQFVLMDKSLKARQTIKYSGKITKGYKWELFLALTIFQLLSFGSGSFLYLISKNEYMYLPLPMPIKIILSVLYIFVIFPWSTLYMAVAYDELSKKYDENKK